MDLVDGVVLAASSPAAAGHVFTMTDGAGVTTADFFGRYAALVGVPPPRSLPTGMAAALATVAGPIDRLRDPASEVNAMSARYLARRGIYSIEKARRILGYAPRVGLDGGFERTARWLRQQGLIP